MSAGEAADELAHEAAPPMMSATRHAHSRGVSLRALAWLSMLALGVGAITRAHARPPRQVSLHFTRGERAEGCIDPVSLARKVEAYTGPVLVAPASAEVALEVHVEARAKGGFRARIQLAAEGHTPHGERILEHAASDCRSFDDALAFVVATTIDPDLVLEKVSVLFDPRATPGKETLLAQLGEARPPPPQSEIASPARAPARMVVLASPAPEKKPAPVRLLMLGLHVSGELPEPALGPSLGARVRAPEWLEWGLAVRAALALRPHPVVDHGSARTQLFGGAILACPRLPIGARLAAAACLGPELELLRAAGKDFAESTSGVRASVRALLRPELTFDLTRSYSLSLAGLTTFGKSHRLVYQSGDEAKPFFETRPVAFGGELAVRGAF